MQLRANRKSERMLGVAFLCASFLPIGACILAIVAGFSAPSFTPMHFGAMGCCLVFFLLTLVLSAVYFFMPKLFPSTFQVVDGKIQYVKGSKVLGQIPLVIVMSVEVLRPQMKPNTRAPAWTRRWRHWHIPKEPASRSSFTMRRTRTLFGPTT